MSIFHLTLLIFNTLKPESKNKRLPRMLIDAVGILADFDFNILRIRQSGDQRFYHERKKFEICSPR